MTKNENLVAGVRKYLDKLETRLSKVPFIQHAADISWEGGNYQFIFHESIKLPEYVEKFRFFLEYPDLEDNGLTFADVKEFEDLVDGYERMTDDEILEEAALYEEDLWKPAGEFIAGIDFDILPNNVVVTMEDGRSTSIHVDADDNGKLQFRLAHSDMRMMRSFYHAKLLRKVENEIEDEDGNKKKVNIHRFFDLLPNNMLNLSIDIGARFGKIGESGMNLIDDGDFWRKPKPSQLFWLLYYQKLADGYKDMTADLIETNDIVEKLFAQDKEEVEVEDESPAVEFYRMVIEGAKKALDDFGNDWMTNQNPYNGRMINSCWKSYTALSEAVNVDVTGLEERDGITAKIDAANKAIKKMIAVINPPFKKGVTVDSFMISTKSLFTIEDADKAIADAVNEWEGRIQAMEALTATSAKQAAASKKLSPFGTVKVTRPTDEQLQWIKDLVAATQPKYVRLIRKAYMLDPVERREAYEAALEKAEFKEERDLFHGTRTENVAAITSCGGPTIHVAAANGRAFGNGSYWSSDPDKSAGYSSWSRYSRWANGSDNYGWLFIGKIHYGKAYDPHGDYNGQSTEEAVKQGGYDVCHAKPGNTVLLRDEIITYDEEHSYVQAVIMIGEPEEGANEE